MLNKDNKINLNDKSFVIGNLIHSMMEEAGSISKVVINFKQNSIEIIDEED